MSRITAWLKTPCTDDEIAYLDTEKKIAYIPIGILENILDEFDTWDTENFQFRIFSAGQQWFASGSVELIVSAGDYKRRLVGAATIKISSRDDNQDFEATVLSLCIGNAAKKLGRRFGRHLNGRMEIGENAVKTSQVREDEQPDVQISLQFQKLKKHLEDAPDAETASSILNASEFRFNVDLKRIVDSKPKKQ